jgi:hypothetical protein
MKSLLLAALIGLGAIFCAQAVPTLETFFEQDNWHITWYQHVVDDPLAPRNYDNYLNGTFIGIGNTFNGLFGETTKPFIIGINQGSVIVDGVEIFGTPFTITQPTGPSPIPDGGDTAALLFAGIFGCGIVRHKFQCLRSLI